MIKQGDKFIAHEDSVGNSVMFWVNTLSFKMEGTFSKGEPVELKDYVTESTKVTFIVEKVDGKILDVPIKDVIFPVSAVGLDKDIIIEEHAGYYTSPYRRKQ